MNRILHLRSFECIVYQCRWSSNRVPMDPASAETSQDGMDI